MGWEKTISRWQVVLAGTEVLVNPDLTCAADPGFELGWEAGIRPHSQLADPGSLRREYLNRLRVRTLARSL